VTPEDFFTDGIFSDEHLLDVELLSQIRAGNHAGRTDVEIAVALLRLAHDELEAYGTGGTDRTDESGIRLILRTSRVLLQRLGVPLDLPFSDYRTFHSHWMANDAYGSWQARRDILNQLFEPVHQELARLEDHELEAVLAKPVTSHPGTGWSRVDTEDQRNATPLWCGSERPGLPQYR